MSNTHGVPDFAAELQSIMGDVLAPCILSATWPIVPVSSLTLAAFATHGFVRDGAQLIYAEQAAAPLTISGADGQFWVALHRNTSTAVASWARQPGTHYLWRTNPTKPAEPAGGLILSQVTVAGGVITAVSQATIPTSPLSLQHAGAVAITGGSATGLSTVRILDSAGANILGLVSSVMAGTNKWNLYSDGSAPSFFSGPLALGVNDPESSIQLKITFPKHTNYGLKFRQTVNDTGPGNPIIFANTGDALIGSIATTATTVAYNTSSDARLKELIEDLPNPLQVIAGLRPITFRWRRNGGVGRGFLAHEVQALVPEAVTGEENAVDAEGAIIPQQIDHSKLVPHLVGAVKALIALNVVRGNQLQALTARVAALEARP